MNKKNILFILPDQMRADYLGCYGATFAKTPNIDKLASEGILYSNAVSPSPLCVPARASLMTGKNSIENGVLNNANWLRPDYHDCGITTLPEKLTKGGYQTVAVGKMHFYPWDIMEGFEKRIISEDKRHIDVQDDYFDALKDNGLRKKGAWEFSMYEETKGAYVNELPKELQADRWIASQACKCIKERDKERPLAMMVGFLSPHCPYDPNEEMLALFDEKDMPEAIPATAETKKCKDGFVNAYKQPWSRLDYSTMTKEQQQKIKLHYNACIADVDECVKKLVEALKEEGIYDDTVIVFSSDHGDFAGDFEMVGKGQFYQPAIHVPMIVRDPSLNMQNKKDDTLVSLTDVHATLLEIAGIAYNSTEDCKALPCYKNHSQERTVFGAAGYGNMIRKGEWKHCVYKNGVAELYNLKDDPQEQCNLYYNEEYRKISQELSTELTIWMMNSIHSANEEKLAGPETANPREKFDVRGFERKYPYCSED